MNRVAQEISDLESAGMDRDEAIRVAIRAAIRRNMR